VVLERRYHFLCAAAAVAQLVTLVLTWPLWSSRSTPPNLSLIDWLSSVPWGWPLAALCVLTVVRPRWGGPAFVVALILACLGDQMRLQPGVLSVAVLMVAPAFGETGRSIARWHLCSLWLWAGLHKFLSRGWAAAGGGADFIVQAYGQPDWLWPAAIAVPLFEIALGASALWPRLWKFTGVGAVALHVGILVTLSPLFADWNSSVWPWNAAVAVAAPLLFLKQEEGAAFPSKAAIAAAAVLLAYPALFYAKAMDAYISHNLYSTNIATATVCPHSEYRCSTEIFDTWDELNVPFPPEPRLFRQAFRERCNSEDELIIKGIKTWITGEPSEHRESCPG